MFGLDLPALPGSYLTHQVICVSCQESFVVSEGRVVGTTGDDGERVGRRNWRLALDRLFSIELRYEQDRYRQAVRSASRADPNIRIHAHEENGQDNYINCPRCGADNRNWLEIVSPRQPKAYGLFDLLMPAPFSRWRQRFPSAYLSILVAIFLGFTTLLLSATEAISVAQGLWIFAAAVLTAGGTADDLTKAWPRMRVQMHLQSILPKRRVGLDSLGLRGIILIVLFAGLFPWLAFRAGPRAMQLGARIVRPANNSNRAVTSDKKQPAALYSDFEGVFNTEMNSFLHDFSRMRSGNIQDMQFLVLKLDRLNTVLREGEKTYREQLVEYFRNPPKTPTQVQNEAEDQEIKGIRENLTFLVLWFVIVGSANACAAFLSIVAVNRYVGFIDSQLPSPIFSSVADMTRVVIWEAKRALQIDGNMGHIQWMEARRNEVGGINLIGLHRDALNVEQGNSSPGQMVRAQRYFISTNIWGRVRDTTIRDVRVPRAIASPDSSQLEWRTGHRNPPFIPIQRPPDPSGNDLAQEFFSVSPISSNQPEESVMAEAVVQQSASSSLIDTADQLSLHLLVPQPNGPESPLEREDRLCKGLALFLNEVFAENELQQLYGALNLDYTRFPGTQLEKCQDLVTFYRRRQRLAELVRECVEMHPHELWGDIFDLYDD